MPARHNAGWIVVDAADRDIAGEIDFIRNRIFQPNRVAVDLRRNDALGLKIPRQRERLVPADIFYIEALPVQITAKR
jgi:hypothetical protein